MHCQTPKHAYIQKGLIRCCLRGVPFTGRHIDYRQRAYRFPAPPYVPVIPIYRMPAATSRTSVHAPHLQWRKLGNEEKIAAIMRRGGKMIARSTTGGAQDISTFMSMSMSMSSRNLYSIFQIDGAPNLPSSIAEEISYLSKLLVKS